MGEVKIIEWQGRTRWIVEDNGTLRGFFPLKEVTGWADEKIDQLMNEIKEKGVELWLKSR